MRKVRHRGIHKVRWGVHVRGGCVQSVADAESAVTSGSIRLSQGRGVSEIAKWRSGTRSNTYQPRIRMLFGLPAYRSGTQLQVEFHFFRSLLD